MSHGIQKQLQVSYSDLISGQIDIGGRDIVIGFNEAPFRESVSDVFDIDSKLNARLLTYFLPAVSLARMQNRRPQLLIASGLFMALRWSAKSLEERKIMTINNHIKLDFLKSFFDTFFPDTFSVIEYIKVHDFLKFPEQAIDAFWNELKKRHPQELLPLEIKLLSFVGKRVEQNSGQVVAAAADLSSSQRHSLQTAIRYAISHIFTLADVYVDDDYIHNPRGYCTIGGHQEKYFNIVRTLAYQNQDLLRELFSVGRKFHIMDNILVTIDDPVAPAYNGATRSKNNGKHTLLDEVTFENELPVSYYDTRPRLLPSMKYFYTLVPKGEYEKFWSGYKSRYEDLKKRYAEAYEISEKF